MSLEQVRIEFTEVRQLYEAYLPFVSGGGLFVPTRRNYAMGQRVTLEVLLPDALETELVEGAVVWQSPQSEDDPLKGGVGFGFVDQSGPLAGRIEKMIAPLANAGGPTATI